MCKFKSAIILKNRVYVPDTDSHTEMLEQLGIEDNYINAQKMFVRAELFPSDNDYFSDISNWEFNVDQDIGPDWFDEDEARGRMIEAVKEWAKNRIYIGVDGLSLKDGSNYMLKDCKNVVLYNSSSVNEMHGSSSVNEMHDSSSVKYMCDSSSVKYMYGSSSVKYMCDSSSVNRMYDSSSVNEMHGSSSVNEMHGSSLINIYNKAIKKDSIILCNNSTIKDFTTKTIYQSGDWELILKEENDI